MKKNFKTIAFFISIFCISCVNTNSASHDKTIELFFSKTEWNDFNYKTLSENKLNHFIDNKIDVFNRQSYFLFMKKNKLDTPYDDFYLIEIEYPNGERAISKKIIVINYDNKITYLGFKKAIEWSKSDLSKDETNKFKYETLINGAKYDKDSYILITHIKSEKY